MADQKISADPSATDLVGAVIPIVQGGANKKAASSLFATPLGFTPENTANKETGSAPTDNSTKYPSSHTVFTALATKQNAIGYTPEDVANKATSLASNDNTHYPTTAAVKAYSDANLASANAYADGLLVSVFKYCGTWDPNVTPYPTSGGTGTAGAIKAGNAFEASAAGGGFDQGDIVVAKIDAPGSTAGNWGTSEHNTQQATTSVRGTAMIVDTTTIQNNATTDDQKIVTAAKFWSGLSTFAGQTNTWASVQTFTSAPKFNSVSASQYLKVDASKNLTSVASIPDGDVSYANRNANLVWAGPASGGAAAPTFRALVTADLAASLVTYAKIQNVTDGSLLGNATGGAAAPSEITVENGLTLAASKVKWGGTLTAATTITNNTVNGLNWTGTINPTTASGQYYWNANPSVTLRATASDSFSAFIFKPQINTGANTQNLTGVVVDADLHLTGAVNTFTALQTNTTASCTNGTTTGFSAYTYTNQDGTGTSASGATFDVTVSGNVITTVVKNATGSGYKIGDKFLFNGSSFGGSGSVFIELVSLDKTISTSSTAFKVINRIYQPALSAVVTPINKFFSGQVLDNTGTAIEKMYWGWYIDGGSTSTVAFGDSFGEVFKTNGSNISFTRAISTSAATTWGTMTTKEIAYGGVNSGTSSSLHFLTSSVAQRFSVNNQLYSGLLTSNTITSGVPATGSITNAGSGYTNGSYSNVTATGGTGTGLFLAITVAGNVVTVVSLTANSAINYKAGDVVSGTFGGGSGFQYTINTCDFTGGVFSSVRNTQTITDNGSGANIYATIYDKRTITQNNTAGTPYFVFGEFNPSISGSPNVYGVLMRPAACLNGFGLGASNPTATIEIGAGASSRAPFKLNSGTVVTSTTGGNFEYNNSFYATKNSGLRFGIGGSIFENYADAGNTTTTETDIFSYTTPANTLEVNGGRIKATYGFNLVNSASTKQIKIYFAGSVIFDSGALTVTAAANVTVDITIIRVSSTVVRYIVNGSGLNTSTSSFSAVGELTSLTLSNTNILKATGTAAGGSAATNDIVGKAADGYWLPVSNN